MQYIHNIDTNVPRYYIVYIQPVYSQPQSRLSNNTIYYYDNSMMDDGELALGQFAVYSVNNIK